MQLAITSRHGGKSKLGSLGNARTCSSSESAGWGIAEAQRVPAARKEARRSTPGRCLVMLSAARMLNTRLPRILECDIISSSCGCYRQESGIPGGAW